MSDNHKAVVCPILALRKHTNADRLKIGLASGYSVIVGLNQEEGERGLFFSEGLQLSEEFAKANDLIQRKDENGNPAGGMFQENRRVKAIRLRGEKSEGFWCPLSHLNFTKYDLSKLKDGDLIDELNGVKICNKYYTRKTQQRLGGKLGKQRSGSLRTFQKHPDTAQLRLNIQNIQVGSTIILTAKIHGTSFRLANCLDERQLTWKDKVAEWFGVSVQKEEYKFLIGSRNVILGEPDEFRSKAAQEFYGKLHQLETIYGEIVGWEREDVPIMGAVSVKGVKDPQAKLYQDPIIYKYGNPNGLNSNYVYRICHNSPNGKQYELSWEQVKERCAELGVKHVVEFCPPFIYDGNKEKLMEIVESFVDGPDLIDQTHPREGVCLRWEYKGRSEIYKHKSFLFKVLEGCARESDDYVDAEEVA